MVPAKSELVETLRPRVEALPELASHGNAVLGDKGNARSLSCVGSTPRLPASMATGVSTTTRGHLRGPALSTESGDGEKRPSPSDARRTPSDLNLGMFMKTVKSRPPVQRPEAAGSKNAGDLLNVSNVLQPVVLFACI